MISLNWKVSPGFSEGDCSLMIQHRGERRQATGGRLSAARFHALIPANHRGGRKERGKKQ